VITLVSHMVNQVVGLRTVEAVLSGVLIKAVHDTMREIWPSVIVQLLCFRDYSTLASSGLCTCSSKLQLLWRYSNW